MELVAGVMIVCKYFFLGTNVSEEPNASVICIGDSFR